MHVRPHKQLFIKFPISDENKRQKNLLDSLAPFIEKNTKTTASVGRPSSNASSNNGASVADERVRCRAPSYESSKAVKGVDGVIYRAAGNRGKGAKTSTIPIVAPTVVAPGCVTTATLEPLPSVKEELKKEKLELLAAATPKVKKEFSTFGTPGFGSNNTQINSVLDDIRAKFPMAGGPSNTPKNNNVIKQVEKKMQDPWEILKTKESKAQQPLLTSPESGNRLLYDPKRRRGRPLDIPDQTIILATPKSENPSPKSSPSSFDQV